MALSRRSSTRFQSSIWPGFVDAMTGLLLVLMFVLTIFMVVQSVLRDKITGQETQLDELSSQVSSLADALGLERSAKEALETELNTIRATLQTTREENAAQEAQIGRLQTEAATLEGSLASLRQERDAQAEEARLAAAKRAALEALVADLESENADQKTAIAASQEALSKEEAARLVEVAAAEALRKRLKESQAELDSLSLILEEERKEAEEALTLLAAATHAQEELEKQGIDALSEAEKREALMKVAREKLAEQDEIMARAQRQQEALNQQVAALRQQLADLQGILDQSRADDAAAKIQVETLGRDLNAALARAAAEERKRRKLEEEKNKDLEKYRSDFFGKLRDVLAGRQDVRIVGDRFVFGAEVLFPAGGAQLSTKGREEIAKVGRGLLAVASEIPDDIDWVLRVDGHTDDTPIVGSARFRDNWELSQARALSVVRFMIDELGVPPNRLSANGFGEFQPLDPEKTDAARAKNRRIELKLTES